MTLQMMRLMDKLWKKNNMNLGLKLYGCVATGFELGSYFYFLFILFLNSVMKNSFFFFFFFSFWFFATLFQNDNFLISNFPSIFPSPSFLSPPPQNHTRNVRSCKKRRNDSRNPKRSGGSNKSNLNRRANKLAVRPQSWDTI